MEATPKEIAANISPFRYDTNGYLYIGRNNKIHVGEYDALGACLAVNSTFGKGYDPSKMEALWKILEKIRFVYHHELDSGDYEDITAILTTAKL